jgi:hypothetical protein
MSGQPGTGSDHPAHRPWGNTPAIAGQKIICTEPCRHGPYMEMEQVGCLLDGAPRQAFPSAVSSSTILLSARNVSSQ